MNQSPFLFHGYRIVTNQNLLDKGPDEEHTRVRSWKERLLTLPWKPWQKTATASTQVPSRQVYRVGNTLVMHPSLLEEIKAQLEQMKNSPTA